MIVLLRRPRVHVPLGGKRRSACLRRFEIHPHLRRINSRLQPQVYHCIRLRIQEVVALVLRIRHAEVLGNVRAQGMNLQRKIAALHCIQKIEPDGELRAELLYDVAAQQLIRMFMHQGQRRRLDDLVAKSKPQAVLLRHTIETPGKVGRFRG